MNRRSSEKAEFERRHLLLETDSASPPRGFVIQEWRTEQRETVVEAVVDAATGRIVVRKPRTARAAIEADDLLIVSRSVALGTMAGAIAATLSNWPPLSVFGLSILSLLVGLSLARSRRRAATK